jgi:membrane protease YdiL (CAAX protease family)
MLLGAALTVLAAVAVVFLTVVLISVVMAVVGQRPRATALGLAATFVLEVCLLAGALVFSLRGRTMSLGDFGFRSFPVDQIYLPPLAVFGTFLALAGYVQFVTLLHLSQLKPTPNIPSGVLEAHSLVITTLIEACIIAPIAEECFFRGFIFRGLLDRSLNLRLSERTVRWNLGFWGAALPSGLLFAASHTQWGLLLPFTFVGVLFAWVFLRTGSLWASILTHAGFNTVSFTLFVFHH